MIYFTSDSHFNDNYLFKREGRPFKNANEGDKFIIKQWNKMAKKEDIIYVIGDFISYSEYCKTLYLKGLLYVKKIKAKVVLILGNNEERLIKGEFNNNFEEFKTYCLSIGFYDVKKEETLEIKGKKYYLNHFPKNHKDGYINLYGHLHKLGGLFKPFGMNISCDMNFLRPYSLPEILKLLSIRDDLIKIDSDLLNY